MTSTLRRPAPAPVPVSGSMGRNGSLSPDETDGSSSSDSPTHVDLNIFMPNETIYSTTVEYGKQMMDLLVQVAVKNKLSPAGHALHIYDERDNPVEFSASQSIGSMGITTLYLVPKSKRNIGKPQTTTGKPFEVTQRLTVNLPRNQKFVTRVNHKCTLAEIYKMICQEKSLDPYKYELRHPTRPDEALNMATPLADYRINEITVVTVTDTGHHNHQLDTSDLNPTTYNSMPRHRKSVDLNRPLPATSGSGSGYMPGMGDGGGKKKGIFSIFSRKKGGKFSPEVAYSEYDQPSAPSSHPGATRSNVTTVTHVSHASTLPRQEPPRSQSHGALPPRQQLQYQQQHPQIQHQQQQQQQQPQYQQPHPQQLPQQRSQPHPQPQQVNVARSVSSEESQTQGIPNNSMQAHKPSRKKRQAPLPPGIPKAAPVIEATAPVTVAVEKSQSMNALSHSRTSSHSSGFDESNVSPLESPGNTARGDTVKRISVNDSSLERTKDLPSGRQSPPQVSAGGVSSLTKKKKKSAPPPPPVPTSSTPEVYAPQPPSTTSIDQSPIEAITAEGALQPNGTVISASPHPPPPPETPGELRVAMVTELKEEISQDASRTSSMASDVSLDSVNDAFDRALQADFSENSTAEVAEYTKKIQTLSTSIEDYDTPDIAISPPPAFTTSVMEKYETEMEEKEERRAVDSDASSDTSSVVEYDINDDVDDVVDDEVALPQTDDSVLLLHSHSLEQQRPMGTVIQVGHSESPPPDSGHASISPVKTDSEYNDSRRELAYNEEISFNNAEVEYVSPSVSKEDTENSSDDDEQFSVNDYRIRNLVKEEVIDFGFRQRELDQAAKKKKVPTATLR